MYRLIWILNWALLFGAFGCGKSKPTQQDEVQLTDQQNNAQHSVDDEERQWQKKQKQK